MNFIDFHVDTLYRLFYRLQQESGDLWSNQCQVDFNRLLQSGYTAQMFACFLDLNKPFRTGSCYQDVLGMIDLFDSQLERYKEKVRFAGDYGQYMDNKAQGMLSAFLTLEEGGAARFPDAPTERGVKHLRGLTRAVEQGYRAAVFFVVQMKGPKSFSPNDATHPAFGAALREAAGNGVGVYAYDCLVTPDGLTLDAPVPVDLSPWGAR